MTWTHLSMTDYFILFAVAYRLFSVYGSLLSHETERAFLAGEISLSVEDVPLGRLSKTFMPHRWELDE